MVRFAADAEFHHGSRIVDGGMCDPVGTVISFVSISRIALRLFGGFARLACTYCPGARRRYTFPIAAFCVFQCSAGVPAGHPCLPSREKARTEANTACLRQSRATFALPLTFAETGVAFRRTSFGLAIFLVRQCGIAVSGPYGAFRQWRPVF